MHGVCVSVGQIFWCITVLSTWYVKIILVYLNITWETKINTKQADAISLVFRLWACSAFESDLNMEGGYVQKFDITALMKKA